MAKRISSLDFLREMLRKEMADNHLTRKGLSKAIGLGDSAVSEILRGKVEELSQDSLRLVAIYFGCSIDDLFQPPHKTAGGVSAITRRTPGARILELDVRAVGGASIMDDEETHRVLAEWEIPRNVLAPQTTSPTNDLKIIQVYGDSMVPDFLPGERVMVDTFDRLPSPPGVFVIWDGFGIVLKRLEMIPYSDPPVVRLISANHEYEPRELPMAAVAVNGRVIGKWKWT